MRRGSQDTTSAIVTLLFICPTCQASQATHSKTKNHTLKLHTQATHSKTNTLTRADEERVSGYHTHRLTHSPEQMRRWSQATTINIVGAPRHRGGAVDLYTRECPVPWRKACNTYLSYVGLGADRSSRKHRVRSVVWVWVGAPVG